MRCRVPTLWFHRGILLLALLSIMPLSGCVVFMESWEWNQKLTVEVVADGEVVSGSAVSHVYWQEADVFDNYGTNYAGEATIVMQAAASRFASLPPTWPRPARATPGRSAK